MEWLNFHHLYYFSLVVRTGSITKASAEARLAPSTVSAQIGKLEDSLGEKLLERRGRNVVPTDMGRMVFRYADEIFSLGREMRDAVKDRPTGRPLRIAVGVANVLPKLVAQRLIAPALQLRESVHLVCREAAVESLLAHLAAHELDVVLSDAPISPAVNVRAYNHLLGECGVVFVTPAALVPRFRKGFPRSLHGAPMLLPTENTGIRRSLDHWFTAHGIRPVIVGEFEDYALLRAFAETGVGIVPEPAVLEGQLRERYGLHRVGLTEDVRSRFYAISVERRLKHPAVLAICDAAKHKLFRRSREAAEATRQG